jgi:hypothetical protein
MVLLMYQPKKEFKAVQALQIWRGARAGKCFDTALYPSRCVTARRWWVFHFSRSCGERIAFELRGKRNPSLSELQICLLYTILIRGIRSRLQCRGLTAEKRRPHKQIPGIRTICHSTYPPPAALGAHGRKPPWMATKELVRFVVLCRDGRRIG